MVDTLIQANNCIFQADIGSGYATVLCAKSFTVNIVTDEKETTSPGDGQFKTFDYKLLSYTVNLNGALKIQDSVNPVVFDFVEYQRGFIPISFRIVWTDKNNAVKILTGICIIKNSNLVTNAAMLADGTVDLIGTGSFDLADQYPDLATISISSTGDNSINAVAKFKLIDTNGEVIFDSGTLAGASAGDLTHPFSTTGTVQKGMYYIFWQATTDSDQNNFSCNAPPTLSTNFIAGTTSESTNTVPQLYDFTANRTVLFDFDVPAPPPTCVPVAIVGSPTLPDGETFVPYGTSFLATGTGPMSITNVTKPSWLTISISESSPGSGNWIVNFSGIPDVSGTTILIEFDIVNACGTANFNDSIDITDNPDVVTINYDYETSTFSVFRLFRNGALMFTPLVATASGSVNVVPGDVLEIHVTASASKHTVVTDTISGTLYDNTTSGITQVFTWTAQLGHDYTITIDI